MSACSPPFDQEDLGTQLYVYGPLRGYVEVDDQRYGYEPNAPEYVPAENPNMRLVYVDTQGKAGIPLYRLGLPGTGDYAGTFTVVDTGPTLIKINTDRPSTGQWDTNAGLIASALFFIEAPVGAIVTIRFATGQDPNDLRVKVDRDNDGHVDDELKPVGLMKGEPAYYFPPRSESSVAHLPDGRVQVTLTGHRVDEEGSDDIGIYYALYPQAPDGQIYDGPFTVDEPGYLIYGAFDGNGVVGYIEELDLLGGLDEDVQFDIPVDGSPIEIDFTAPGQQALLTYPAELGDEFELEFVESTVGVLPDAGIGYGDGLGLDGGLYYFKHRNGSKNQIRLDPEWGYTGTVVLQLTNVHDYAPELTLEGPAMQLNIRPAGRRQYVRISNETDKKLFLRAVATDIEEDFYTTGVLQLVIAEEAEGGYVRRKSFQRPGEAHELFILSSVSYVVEISGEADTIGSVRFELIRENEQR